MKRLLLPVILLASYALQGTEICHVKSNRINEVLNQVMPGKKKLVLFDIDFTLGIPTPLGLFLIEQEALNVLSHLKEQKVDACALTARMPHELPKMAHQLKKINIDFSSLTPFADNTEYTVNSRNESCTIKHTQGIICAGLCSKTDAIRKFMQEQGYTAEQIILIDDKPSNFITDTQALTDLGVERITNIHYTRILGGLEFDYFKPISRLYKKYKTKCLGTAVSGLAFTTAVYLFINRTPIREARRLSFGF